MNDTERPNEYRPEHFEAVAEHLGATSTEKREEIMHQIDNMSRSDLDQLILEVIYDMSDEQLETLAQKAKFRSGQEMHQTESRIKQEMAQEDRDQVLGGHMPRQAEPENPEQGQDAY